MLVGQGDDSELRDHALGQVVKLGEAAAIIVSLLDGKKDAAALLLSAGRQLGSPLDPMGLVDLLQALDQRALLDTPRARAIVSQGLVRADVAALRRISQRARPLMQLAANPSTAPKEVRMAPGSNFTCNSCTRCCTSKHLLGPVSADEVQKILNGFEKTDKATSASSSDFLPLSNNGEPPESFLLRTENGRCTFLQESGLCGIHEQLGAEFKPAACRLFPYRPVRTVSGWDIGLSLSCPSVVTGAGEEASAEALETVTALARTSSLLQVLTDSVQLDSQCKVPYEEYRNWEEESIQAILDEEQEPGHAWVKAVERFEALLSKHTSNPIDPWLDNLDNDDCPTVELSAPEEHSSPLSERGQGELSADVGHAADILLRDLAIWLELLIGLEAADPAAIRRIRRSIVRIRINLGVSPRAATVLAERARLSTLLADTADTLEEDLEATSLLPLTETKPAIRAVPARKVDPAQVQRLFLTQALTGKALFRYSSIRHGLLAVTIHLGMLRLEHLDMDPFAAEIEDISYLFQHPQFTDVIDSRAVVRHHDRDAGIHRSILGVGYTD